MKLLLLLSTVFVTTILSAQDTGDYSGVDSRALAIPRGETFTTSSIAGFINQNFTDNKQKVRAAYKWITANIRYSKDSMYFSNWGGDPELKMEATLRKRSGVCENYAGLLANIVAKCGIRSIVVSGYTSLNGSVSMAGHSWCAVEIDNEWLLCDPTWDGGFTTEARYFLIKPDEFISTHMPFDPLWQLLPYPVSHKEFRKGYSYSKKQDTAINVMVVVGAYLAMDTLQQLESTARRTKEAGLENEDLKTWHDYNKMKVNIVYQEQDMNLYNAATDALNKAKKKYNQFVQFRNDGLLPSKSSNEIKTLFDSIEASIDQSRKTAQKIGLVVENYQYDTGELLLALDKLAIKLKEQRKFYSNTLAGNRTPAKQY